MLKSSELFSRATKSNTVLWVNTLMWYVWGEGELLTEFRCGNHKEREHLENLGLDGKILLKCISKKWAATA
jgi:hypothetical protein